MISAEALQMLDREKEYLTPDGMTYQEVEPAIHALVLPYELEPWRDYHAVSHLVHMANYLHSVSYELRNPRAVFLGKNAHDSFQQPWLYDTRLRTRGINETVSADNMETIAGPYYTKDDIVACRGLILATAGHSTEGVVDTDLAHFLDADMRIVGETDEVFDGYDTGVMHEFTYGRPEVTRLYQIGRMEFLTRLDERRIFCTQYAQDLYESQAHKNLKRTIGRYAAELAAV